MRHRRIIDRNYSTSDVYTQMKNMTTTPASVNARTLSAICVLVTLANTLHAEDLNYSVSSVGNSFSGKNAWVLQDVADIFVDADGAVFTNVPWDEAGGNVQQFQDGKLIRVAQHTHGWGYQGGEAITANAQFVFIAQIVENEGGGLKGNSWPPKGFSWAGVSRRLRSDVSKAAPFEGGHGKEGDSLHSAFLPINELPELKNDKVRGIRGLAATESKLIVSSPFDNSIKVYDAGSMNLLSSWNVNRPDKICLDKTGALWVLQRPDVGAENWTAQRFSLNGKLLPQDIEFDKSMRPTGLCVDVKNRLLVSDAGPDQQVKIYESIETSPRLKDTLGAKGGIFAPPVSGAFGDLRFNRLSCVGADAAGKVYVASSGSVAGGSTVLERYAPDGKLGWRVMGLTFVDMGGLDPASETDMFTKEEHFVLDYAQSAGQEWSYRGYTVDPAKYPDDPRLHTNPTHTWVRRIKDGKFLFVSDMTGELLSVYRFDPAAGEIAIPCALISKKHLKRNDNYPPHQPAKGEWIWLDQNGNGAIDEGEFISNSGQDSGGICEPDSNGALWQTFGDKIRMLPVQPLDEHGAPVWAYSQARTWPKPPDLDEIRRLHYLPESDTMLLGGNKGADRNQHWKPMGPVLCIYENWSDEQKRKLKCSVVLPYEKGAQGHESAEPISFDVIGDFVFVAYTRGLKADGLKNAFVKVYRLSDLSVVGNLNCEKELGEIGLLDIVESVQAARRANGEYVILLEDDYKSKIVMFRWKP